MSAEESQKREHRQPGPGATAQGGPRSEGDQGGTGGSSKKDKDREQREREQREQEESGRQPLPGRQAGAGAARTQ
jgi:hypothetical protein